MAQDETRDLSSDEKWQLLTRQEKLGEILVKHGKLSLTQLEDLIKEQQSSGKPLGELIVEKGVMSRDDILEALNWQRQSDRVSSESVSELKDKQKDS